MRLPPIGSDGHGLVPLGLDRIRLTGCPVPPTLAVNWASGPRCTSQQFIIPLEATVPLAQSEKDWEVPGDGIVPPRCGPHASLGGLAFWGYGGVARARVGPAGKDSFEINLSACPHCGSSPRSSAPSWTLAASQRAQERK